MSNLCNKNEEHIKRCKTISNRESLEEKALGYLTTEILQKLNIRLPNKSRILLEDTAELQTELELQTLDPIALSLNRSRELSAKLEEEYEILKMKQKNAELQMKIDRNNRFISNLRKDLESSKQSLAVQNPNPDNIQDIIRQLKQKLKAYEDCYEQTKNKYTGLNVPETILPKSLNCQISSLHALREEAIVLKEQADDVTFMRETKATLYRLRK